MNIDYDSRERERNKVPYVIRRPKPRAGRIIEGPHMRPNKLQDWISPGPFVAFLYIQKHTVSQSVSQSVGSPTD